jgi:aromatic ring-opening dioxygenase LigB subunit
MIVFAAIAPHGGLVFEQPEAPTRRGMDELARRFQAARPEATIVVTPHGTLVDGHFAVVRSGKLSEHPNRFIDAEHPYDAPAVVVTPCRALSNEEHVRAGAALARATGERRVAFVASADHGHGHTADGPYGFAPESKEYDYEAPTYFGMLTAAFRSRV